MRPILGVLALASALWAPRPAAAQSLDMFFTLNSTRAVSVQMSTAALNTSTTFYSFGTIVVGSAALSNLPVVVTNVGNLATTLSLQVSSATDLGTYPAGTPQAGQPLNQGWAVSTSPVSGVDSFALFAVFQSSQPVNGSIASAANQVGSAPVLASTGTFQGGNQSGVLVPAVPGSNSVDLWFDLYVPQRSSNLFPKQFSVTVTAN